MGETRRFRPFAAPQWSGSSVSWSSPFWNCAAASAIPERAVDLELYRQMAAEQETRETALIAAPDPRLRRETAILQERQRFADIVAVRLPTAEEITTHTAAIDQILCGRHSYA
jgi:hypothetical protein